MISLNTYRESAGLADLEGSVDYKGNYDQLRSVLQSLNKNSDQLDFIIQNLTSEVFDQDFIENFKKLGLLIKNYSPIERAVGNNIIFKQVDSGNLEND